MNAVGYICVPILIVGVAALAGAFAYAFYHFVLGSAVYLTSMGNSLVILLRLADTRTIEAEARLAGRFAGHRRHMLRGAVMVLGLAALTAGIGLLGRRYGYSG